MREKALAIWHAGVEAAKPVNAIDQFVKLTDQGVEVVGKKLNGKRLFVCGAGKASLFMAKEVERILGDRISGGVIISNMAGDLKHITALVGSHPVLDSKTINATKELVACVDSLEASDDLIFLLSGGASSLLELPASGITLDEMQAVFKSLLASGAPIEDVNCVRKHISQIKGGNLGARCKANASVLVISDVVGDDLEAIGSAPLFMDKTTFEDARDIVKNRQIELPKSVADHLRLATSETPKTAQPNITHHLIATNKLALKAMADQAVKLGLKPLILSDKIEGEAKEVAKALVGIARGIESDHDAIIFGGETTVTLQGGGKGGRNQEMALSALKAMKGDYSICFVSGGSDGIDGNSTAAGAIADKKTADQMGDLSIDSFLAENNSFAFFEATNSLIMTGATGTNVMDLGVIITRNLDFSPR